MSRTPVIDAHMHIGEFPLFGASSTVADLEQWMDECAIDMGIVFAPDNDMVASHLADNPRFRALVWVNPHQDGHLEELERLLDTDLFVGAKLHPLINGFHPNDAIVQPVMRVLAERRRPALVHCGHPIFSLPWSIEELAADNPDVAVILGHMGHGNIVYINAAIDVAERRPNVYLETSGMPTLSRIPHAVERVGRHKVLFGSDAPLHHPGLEKDKIVMSGIEGDDLAAVLGGSAADLFGLGS
jgi:uncharacterized protein